MYIEVVVDGEHYIGKTLDSYSADLVELAEETCDTINIIRKYQLNLANGGILVLGKEAVRRAHIIFQTGKSPVKRISRDD